MSNHETDERRTPADWSRDADLLTRWGRVRKRGALIWAALSHHRERLTSAGVVVLAFGFIALGVWMYANDRATTKATRAACERSRYFGEPNYREHIKNGIYTANQLEYFKATIPKDCP